MQRWMLCTDTHGDKIDPAARDAAMRFRDAFQPEVRIDGGDIFDFRPLRKGASEDEILETLAADVEAGQKWLKDYQPTQVLLGNHDWRLWDRAQDCTDGVKAQYLRQMIDNILDGFDLAGTQWFPYDIERGVFQYGDTKFLHGYGHGMHIGYHLAMEYGNAIMGHVHQFQESPGKRVDRTVGRTCGCMCKLDMGYNRRRTASFRWSQGFMYGWKDEDGTLYVQTLRPVAGKWHVPKEFPI